MQPREIVTDCLLCQIRAMSKDIEERHERMKKQKQISERYRELGNEQYKNKQYTEALKIYQTGIELGERYAFVTVIQRTIKFM